MESGAKTTQALMWDMDLPGSIRATATTPVPGGKCGQKFSHCINVYGEANDPSWTCSMNKK